MAGPKSFALALLAAGAAAQQALLETDPNTGIGFQTYKTPAGYSFGIALPMTPSSDFIGRITSPIAEGAGWGGVSLGGAMVNKLLIAAFPNGDAVQAGFRVASEYANPSSNTGDYKMIAVAKGTSINETHLTFTFLCEDCLNGDEMTFRPDAETAVLGFAHSSAAVASPGDPETALNYHEAFGNFGLPLAEARSEKFDCWASMATNDTASCDGSVPTPTGTEYPTGYPTATHPPVPTGYPTGCPTGTSSPVARRQGGKRMTIRRASRLERLKQLLTRHHGAPLAPESSLTEEDLSMRAERERASYLDWY